MRSSEVIGCRRLAISSSTSAWPESRYRSCVAFSISALSIPACSAKKFTSSCCCRKLLPKCEGFSLSRKASRSWLWPAALPPGRLWRSRSAWSPPSGDSTPCSAREMRKPSMSSRRCSRSMSPSSSGNGVVGSRISPIPDCGGTSRFSFVELGVKSSGLSDCRPRGPPPAAPGDPNAFIVLPPAPFCAPLFLPSPATPLVSPSAPTARLKRSSDGELKPPRFISLPAATATEPLDASLAATAPACRALSPFVGIAFVPAENPPKKKKKAWERGAHMIFIHMCGRCAPTSY
mmetsp:Transcript_26867/g.67649  ORF Transcript_26867/g.67649 Transcript_26867/m.67649 type:complete len:290 (-) Transcript_26867:2898-3767(-)